MTLIDANILIALIDKADANHHRCRKAAATLRTPQLLTTWPCITEAMYLLGSLRGFRAQALLWSRIVAGGLVALELTHQELNRIGELMEVYQNVPMDLADASLVSVADIRGIKQVFTLDSDFHIYRLGDGSVLEVVP